MKKRPDKNSIIPAVVGFVGVIDEAILPPAGAKRCSEKDTLSVANSPA